MAPTLRSSPPPLPPRKTFIPPQAATTPRAPASWLGTPLAVVGPAARAAISPAVAPIPPTKKSSPPDGRPRFITTPAPTKARATMASLDEIVVQLFESMFDLNFLDNSVDGARFCLALALEKFPSRVGYAHLFDINTRQFVVACAHGPGAPATLGQRHDGEDPTLAAAMRAERAVIFGPAHAASAPARYAPGGTIKSAVVAPVIHDGRFLGALELVNPCDDEPFRERERDALTYIAERFAEFVASRGVIVSAETIAELTAQS